MTIDEVRWDADVPDEVRRALRPHLSRLLPLVPTWVQDFQVAFDPEKACLMECNVNYPYRWAVIIVTGQWLQSDDESRRNAVRHELLHIALQPMQLTLRRFIEDLTEEGTATRELCESMYVDGMESSVQDLARGIGRLVGG